MDVEEGIRDRRSHITFRDSHGCSKRRQRILRVIVGVVLVCVIIGIIVGVTLHHKHQPAQPFRERFIDKCEKFDGKKDESCKSVFDAFENAFVGKSENNVTEDDYEGLFKAVPFTHPGDKIMLWSGINREKTNDLVHRFTKTRDHFFTLEDTLLGHVMDGLTWCGKVESEEIFSDSCRIEKPNPVFSFWKKASAKVAQYAHGTVTVMLDGERPEPYYNKSVLATVEVPNLRSPEVKKLDVILVVQKEGEKCNKASLKNLSNTLKSKNIEYVCKEVTQAHIEKCITEKTTGSCW